MPEHDQSDRRDEPELPPPTAGSAASLSAEPTFRLSAAWPYIGAAIGGIALVLVVGLVFIAKPLATSAKAQASPANEATPIETSAKAQKGKGGGLLTTRKPAEAELPRTKTAVLVLNGSGKKGAAREAATRLRTAKYDVIGATDAAHPDYRRTLVLYRDGFRGEAERLARDLELGWKRVAPVDGMKRRELGEARVVLILAG